ncbi:lysylphosphatidylglycerol synthase transmembrane domain-containing protein [Lunatimonas salinarum]|uniref:lysylphosphatidylglycerol synthase transmembrane domain-containing protein n=1 Tax=Lunatimonas salinarum TaxID=1774590 RepID=UPI001AE0E7F7
MRLTAKQLIQLFLSLAAALGIFAFVYRDLDAAQLRSSLEETSFFWVAVSIFLSLIGYWLRAWRWKLLIDATEDGSLKTSTSFWALMFGYLVNLILPRAGELARCAALKKTNQLKMGSLLGTVVLERTVDVGFMLALVLLAFIFEAGIFLEISQQLFSSEQLVNISGMQLVLLLGVVAIMGVLLWKMYQRLQGSAILSKLQGFFRQFVRGVKSISNLRNPKGFWVSSIGIWIIYYAMMYFISWSMYSTSSLSASSVLMVLVMGSIGMVAPVQGGIGTFHALVAFILFFYGVPESQGKIFALIVHGSQVATVLIVGLLSLAMLGKLTWKIKPQMGSLRKDV